MSKFELKSKARHLRSRGESIKDIALQVGISKSTASTWCQEIELSEKQIAVLKIKMYVGGHKGRVAGARTNKNKKLEILARFKEKGIKRTRNMNDKNLLMLGLGLYLGEGNKSGNRFQFTNSNPEILKIMILWLERLFKISRKDLYFRLLINESHADRVKDVEKKWQKILSIYPDQFRRVTLVRSKTKKIYENQEAHLGTLVLRVRRSSSLQYETLGLLKGLVYNINAKMPA